MHRANLLVSMVGSPSFGSTDIYQTLADNVLGVKFNLPSLTKSMGFTSTHAQLLSVPPYILAGIACVVIPHLSDRYGTRAACKSSHYILQ